MASTQRPNIYQFLDYREFLSAMRDYFKSLDPCFSQRKFAVKAGIPKSNASILTALINGRKNLSSTYLLSICNAFELKNKEIEYFESLVHFNQTSNLEEKNHFFRLLSRFQGSRAQKISSEHYGIFSNWYTTAIWHWVGLNENKAIAADSYRVFQPEITMDEFEIGLQLLVASKWIVKMANGYQVSGKHLATPPQVRDIALMEYYKQMILLSKDALVKIPANERDFRAISFSISAKGYEAVLERSTSFFEEIREILDHDEEEDRVCHLGLQLFPVTNEHL